MENKKRKKQKVANDSEAMAQPKLTTSKVDTTTHLYHFESLTASNLEASIPELSAHWYLGQLCIALQFSNHSRRTFENHYQAWEQTRAFSFEDHMFARDYQAYAKTATTRFSDESVLMKAVFTYHAIFTKAQAAGNPELLYAVTARLLDMIMALICKCHGLDRAETNVPDTMIYFSAAVKVLRNAPSRLEAHALHEFMAAPRDSYHQDMPLPDLTARLNRASQPPPCQTSIGGGAPAPRAPMACGSVKADNTNVSAMIEASVGRAMETPVTWDNLHMDPALMAFIDVILSQYLAPNPKARQTCHVVTPSFLFFGVTGTGKSLLAKAIARKWNCTFYDVDIADLNSKWHGDSEKYINALFDHAIENQPSLVFIDELDSLMRERTESDMSVTAQIKSTILKKWGAITHQGSKVLVIGTTRLPEVIDSVFIRRFTHKLLIKAPTGNDRNKMLSRTLTQILSTVPHKVSQSNMLDLWRLWLKDDASLTAAQLVKLVSMAQNRRGASLLRVKCWAEIPAGAPSHDTELVPWAAGLVRCTKVEKFFSDLTEDQKRRVARQPVTYLDLVSVFDRIYINEHEKRGSALEDWNKRFGEVLTDYESMLAENARERERA